MTGVQIKAVAPDDDGIRLDRWFKAHFPDLRHGQLEKLLRKGQIRVDGGRVKSNSRLQAGQSVRVPPYEAIEGSGSPKQSPRISAAQSSEAQRRIQEMVVFEDDALLAINKPSGLAVQGGTGTKQHLDRLLLEAFGEEKRPKLVHRLDRDTSGLLILAKSRAAAAKLSEVFRLRRIEKTYLALTAGVPEVKEGTIAAPLSKLVSENQNDEREKMGHDDDHGKKAITDYMTLDTAGPVGFLALKPVTGRTHQLRVHTAMMDTPIIGDGKYGGAGSFVEGVDKSLHLHCLALSFPHPTTGRYVHLSAEVAGHMAVSCAFFNFRVPESVDWPDIKAQIRKKMRKR
ncbi:MAG: RluA family pseudouridine synthase [Pseudomonadota bacterium]